MDRIVMYIENPVILPADENNHNKGYQLYDDKVMELQDVVGMILRAVTGKIDAPNSGEKLLPLVLMIDVIHDVQ